MFKIDKQPGGIIIEPDTCLYSNMMVEDNSIVSFDSFNEGEVKYSIADFSFEKKWVKRSFKTSFSKENIIELYDLISNHTINVLYLDTAKKFIFVCPEFLRPILFDVEFELCSLFSTLNGKFIGQIRDGDKVIYGRPCIKSKPILSFYDIVFKESNSIEISFSQIERKDNGSIEIVTDETKLHTDYQFIFKGIKENFDDFVKNSRALSTINEVNKLYQLLFLIHKSGSHQIPKVKSCYYASLDTFLINKMGMNINVRPSYNS